MTHSFHSRLKETQSQIIVATKASLAAVLVIFVFLVPRLWADSQKEYIYINGMVVAVETDVAQIVECVSAISPPGASYTAVGGSGSASVTNNNGCVWAATSNVSWITITGGGSGTGNGTVSYTVAANAGSQRSGTLTIAGQTFTITQSAPAPGCAYTVSPPGASYTAVGGSGSASVATSGSCAWTATSNVSWITITGGGSGTGNGTVSYTVAANAGSQRSGTLTIAGQTFTITQDPIICTYAVSPTTKTVAAVGGNGTVTVTRSNVSCPATSATSNASWITVTVDISGNVNYTVATNYGTERSGTVTISGNNTLTITQIDGLSCSAQYSACDANAQAQAAIVCPNLCQQEFNNINCHPSYPICMVWIANCISECTTQFSYECEYQYGACMSSSCVNTISPSIVNLASGGVSGSVSVTAASGCYWTATSNAFSWIAINSGSAGTGDGTVGYTVAANTGPQRSGTLTIAGKTFMVIQDAFSCSYAISPSSASLAAGGGSGSVNVTAASGCVWTAASNASWITITGGGSGSGNGTVSYTVAANTGTQRSGTLTIAGQTFTVTQAALSCSYAISPSSASLAAGGGLGSVSVTATSGCAWAAASNVSWITITGGGSGTGNGMVSYTVAANTGTQRSGTLTIAGKTFTVTQAAPLSCSYTISPTSASPAAGGGGGSVSVATTSGCAWTAVSNVSWITITGGGSGTSSGTVSYTVAANTGSARSGTITIGGKTFTVNQGGCTFSLSPTSSGTVNINGGSGSFTVNAGGGCAWTAASNVSWITITGGGSGSGNGTVSYSVGNNSSGPQRSGSITAGGQNFTVSQDGQSCAQYCSAFVSTCIQTVTSSCVASCVAQNPNCAVNPAMCSQLIQACTSQCQSQAQAQCSSVYSNCMAACQ